MGRDLKKNKLKPHRFDPNAAPETHSCQLWITPSAPNKSRKRHSRKTWHLSRHVPNSTYNEWLQGPIFKNSRRPEENRKSSSFFFAFINFWNIAWYSSLVNIPKQAGHQSRKTDRGTFPRLIPQHVRQTWHVYLTYCQRYGFSAKKIYIQTDDLGSPFIDNKIFPSYWKFPFQFPKKCTPFRQNTKLLYKFAISFREI